MMPVSSLDWERMASSRRQLCRAFVPMSNHKGDVFNRSAIPNTQAT
jgi:hypothetical protein